MRLRRSPARFRSRALVRERGRIGLPGAVREGWFDTEAAAIEAGAAVCQRKEKRGYHAVDGFDKAG